MSQKSNDTISTKLEELNVTQDEINSIGEALKKEEFRNLLCEYVKEIQDPENRKIYEQEVKQLEKERGVDVTFITPNPDYVIKTSFNGNTKVFINICSNDNIGVPVSTKHNNGLNWNVPYVLAPPRIDFDKKQSKCNVYDVVFHPQALELGKDSKEFKQLIHDTALNGIEQSFNIKLDKINLKFPKLQFKGVIHPTIIRKKCDKISSEENNEHLCTEEDEIVQKCNGTSENITSFNRNTNGISNNQKNNGLNGVNVNDGIKDNEVLNENIKNDINKVNGNNTKDNIIQSESDNQDLPLNYPYEPLLKNKEPIITNLNILNKTKTPNNYETPKYIIKELNEISLQNYTTDPLSKKNITIPNKIIIEINLPLLNTTEFVDIKINNYKLFELICNKPSKYKLNIKLPYNVNEENGNAKFDLDKKLLIITLPVIYENKNTENDKIVEDNITNTEINKDNKSFDKIIKGQLNNEIFNCLNTNDKNNVINELNIANDNNELLKVQNDIKNKTDNINYLEINNTNDTILNIKNANMDDVSDIKNDFQKNGRREKVLIEEINESDSEQVNKNVNGCKTNGKVKNDIENISNGISKLNVNSIQNKEMNGCGDSIIPNGVKSIINNKETILNGTPETVTNSTNGKHVNGNQETVVNNTNGKIVNGDTFWNDNIYYILPNHDVNSTDNRIVFIFNILNVEIDSLSYVLDNDDKIVKMKFSSIGNGFYRSYYGIILKFENKIKIKDVFCSESNVILKLNNINAFNKCYYYHNTHALDEIKCCIPEPEYYLDHEFKNDAQSDSESSNKTNKTKDKVVKNNEKSKENEEDEEDKENRKERKSKRVSMSRSVSTSSYLSDNDGRRVRGILKTSRSFSCSYTSDEEINDDDNNLSTSLPAKKHVRFDSQIHRKMFSSTTSILEQEKKYQKRLRHMLHKRERRLSESDNKNSNNNGTKVTPNTGSKTLSKKQLKKLNRQKNNQNNNGQNNGNKKVNGNENGNNNELLTSECLSETSEDESSKASCSCSQTSESGGETSDSCGDNDHNGSGGNGGVGGCNNFEMMKLNMLSSRKSHKKRGKKNVRKYAANVKNEYSNNLVFDLDMN